MNGDAWIWLFDYDLTIYDATERFVLDSLDKKITQYVKKALQVSTAEASKIREQYLQQYGTTLAGLRALHGTEPDDYFDFIHQKEGLIYPAFAKEKSEMLKKLPGHKIIFTNGRGDWTSAGLKSMGIEDCFETIIDLKMLHWVGKPHAVAYEFVEKFLRQKYGEESFKKSKIILIDDAEKNLKPAKEKNWKTVWTALPSQKSSEDFQADFQISSILELQTVFQKLSVT